LGADGPDASVHSTTGWTTVETMLLWLHFIRGLPDCADGHDIDLFLGCDTVHRCAAVRERTERLRVHLHFISPGLTGIVQPLDRSVFGGLKAELRTIYRGNMAHREDKRMTKAEFTAYLMLACDLVSEEAVHRGWTCYDRDTRGQERELQTAVAPNSVNVCGFQERFCLSLPMAVHGPSCQRHLTPVPWFPLPTRRFPNQDRCPRACRTSAF
jgi:hypothetical protein